MSAYADHILEARDVCANCHRIVRVERLDPVRGGLGQDLDSHYSRRVETTSVEFGPADVPSESKGVFCECGVEGGRVQDRLWGDVDRERFKRLLVATVESLAEKGVTCNQERTIGVAVSHFKDGCDADDALEAGVDAGLAVATSAGADATAD